MLKKMTVIGLSVLVFTLPACSREQEGVNTVTQREKPSDFTTLPDTSLPPKIETPEIPGKAVIPGAPIPGYVTKTGEASASAAPTSPPASP